MTQKVNFKGFDIDVKLKINHNTNTICVLDHFVDKQAPYFHITLIMFYSLVIQIYNLIKKRIEVLLAPSQQIMFSFIARNA